MNPAVESFEVCLLMASDLDARTTAAELAAYGINATVCREISKLCERLSEFGAAVIVEEYLDEAGRSALRHALDAQPPWSDFPLIVIAGRKFISPSGPDGWEDLPNATILTRPLRLDGLINAIQIALRARRRQYGLRAYLAEMKVVADIGLAIRSSLEPEEIEQTAVQLLGAALLVDRCYFAHVDIEMNHIRIDEGFSNPDIPPFAGDYVPSQFNVDLAELCRDGNNLVIRTLDDGQLPAESVAYLRSLQMEALVSVPLFRNERLAAVLTVATSTSRDWKAEEVSLIEAVAAQCRTAIEAAATIQRERRIATTLENAMLPPLPTDLPGLRLAYAYQAALDESNIGGDFYAAYPINAEEHAIVIGDVSGKGLAAASQVASLQSMLRYALLASDSLVEAIDQMNATLVAHDLLAGFATLFVGIYNPERRRLRYCSCGHEPPVVTGCGRTEFLLTCGPPIGSLAEATYCEYEIQLFEGDLIMLYTDGLSEAGPDRRSLLGGEGLAAFLRNHANDGDPSEIAGGILGDVLAFAQGRLQDDVCLILAQVTAANETTARPADQPATVNTFSATPDRQSPAPAEQQLRLLVDSVAEYAICLLDPAGHVRTWNRGAERLNGYSASEIVGKHFSVFYTEADVRRGHPLDELAIAASEGRYEEEGWRVRKDGTLFWASVVITALYSGSGTLTGFGKVVRDFTDRRRAEQQLRLSEERFRHLVQGVRDYAIFMLDPTGHVLSWNEGAERMKGYAAHEIIGKHFSIFYTAEDLARSHPAHELAVAADQGKYEEEGWRLRKDGTRFWANVLITALRDERGEIYGFAKVTRDVTDRRASEEARLQGMRDDVSRSLLREVLYSVTEGRLRFCDTEDELPVPLPCVSQDLGLTPDNLGRLRRAVGDAARLVGFSDERIMDFVSAVSEAGMNAVVHGRDARYSVCRNDSCIQVWIHDNGSGIEIETLHRATLERGYTTENSLGHGFWLILRTCDRIWLQSSSTGTTIVLEQNVVPPEPEWLVNPPSLNGHLIGV